MRTCFTIGEENIWHDRVHAFPGKGHLKPSDEELRRVKKELNDDKEERDILKKALAIFSKHPR
jgi:transposase